MWRDSDAEHVKLSTLNESKEARNLQTHSHTSSTLKLIYLTRFVELTRRRKLLMSRSWRSFNESHRKSVNKSLLRNEKFNCKILFLQTVSMWKVWGTAEVNYIQSLPTFVSLMNVNLLTKRWGKRINYVTSLFAWISLWSVFVFFYSPSIVLSHFIPFNLIGLISHNALPPLLSSKWKFYTSCSVYLSLYSGRHKFSPWSVREFIEGEINLCDVIDRRTLKFIGGMEAWKSIKVGD